MTGHVTSSKSDRALALHEQKLSYEVIAQRIGSSQRHIGALIQNGLARREREAKKLQALADMMGPNT